MLIDLRGDVSRERHQRVDVVRGQRERLRIEHAERAITGAAWAHDRDAGETADRRQPVALPEQRMMLEVRHHQRIVPAFRVRQQLEDFRPVER